jgi:hypothetical protein
MSDSGSGVVSPLEGESVRASSPCRSSGYLASRHLQTFFGSDSLSRVSKKPTNERSRDIQAYFSRQEAGTEPVTPQIVSDGVKGAKRLIGEEDGTKLRTRCDSESLGAVG